MSPSRIDVHCHFLPDFYRAALVAAGQSQPDGIPALPDWSEAESIATLDRLGVATAFLSVSSPGVHFGDDGAARALSRHLNEAAARLVRAYPGRYGFFAVTPLPDVAGALDEIGFAFDNLAADGVVLETNFHGVYLGDGALEPIYQALDRRNAVAFIHPTSPHCPCGETHAAAAGSAYRYPAPMLEFIFETTRSVADLILSGVTTRYPNIRFIVPHAGAALPILANRIEGVLAAMTTQGGSPPDLWGALKRFHYDLAGAPVPQLLGALLSIADAGRLHYGSDWPFTPIQACAAMAEKLDTTDLLGPELRAAVMRDNAIRLFPRLAPEGEGRP